MKKYVEDLGFALKVTCRVDDSDLVEIVKESDPALLLVDFDLGDGTKGDAIVDKLRGIELYSFALFYSQKYSDFEKRISGKLEGVYFTKVMELYSEAMSC